MAVTINPDKKIADMIKEGLRIKGGHCPCRIEKTEDTKCMCKEFRETDEGMCHCGLYIKTKE